MTRYELWQQYPRLYRYYSIYAHGHKKEEEFFRIFEKTPLPKVSEYRVENALASALLELGI